MTGILCHPIEWNLNGLELSELQRYFMFKNMGYSLKFYSFDFNEYAAMNYKHHGIKQRDVINMWDYYQGVDSKKKILSGHPTAFEIGFDRDVYIVPKDGISHVMKNDNEIATINFFPGTEQVHTVNYLDKYENKIYTDIYDCRGFKSRTLYLNEDGLLVQSITYDINGNEIAHENFNHINNSSVVTMIELVYKGKEYSFNNYWEMFKIFLEEILSDGENVLAERIEFYNVLLSVNKDINRYFTARIHVSDVNETVTGKLVPELDNILFKYPERVKALIVPTLSQKKDIIAWFEKRKIKLPVKIHVASLAVTKPKKKILIKDRKPMQFVSVASMINNRHPKRLIRYFSVFAQKHPEAHLDIYSLEKNELFKECQKLINNLGMYNHIKLQGYTDNLNFVLDQAVGFISFASGDPQPIALILALEHGVPVIARDVPYGYKEIVKSGKNGFLFSFDSEKEFFDDLNMIISTKAQKFSDNAYYSARKFDSKKVFPQWRFLIK